jgi:hypothetical protein
VKYCKLQIILFCHTKATYSEKEIEPFSTITVVTIDKLGRCSMVILILRGKQSKEQFDIFELSYH